MKVKVINKNTNQQFDCQEIEIDAYKYYLYYNTEPKKIGQYYITKENQIDIVKTGKELGKPILCTNNPNIDIPKVVNEVETLALKEKHVYSNEDIIEFLEWIKNDNYIFEKWATNKINPKKLLEIWKEQQAKIIYYE